MAGRVGGPRAPRTPSGDASCASCIAEVLGLPPPSAWTTTSSTWAATRCWRRVWSAGSARCSASRCRSASLFEAPRVADACAAGCRSPAAGAWRRRRCGVQPRPARSGCRCRMRSAGCGSWSGWPAGCPGRSGAPRAAPTPMPLAVRLTGEPLDRAALVGALNDLVERHESLRTVFPERLGVPYQRVADLGARPQARLRRCRPCGHRDCRARRRRGLAAGIAGPGGAVAVGFELSSEELPLRAHLYELPPGAGGEPDRVGGQVERYVLLIVLHHIAGDGWSLSPLARDLASAYRARHRGEAPGWAALPVQYVDYTLWQHELLGREEDPESRIAQQLGYWRTQLANLPDQIELPSDRPRPAMASRRGGTVHLATLDAALHGRLLALARTGQASLFMVLQAGLAALLSRLGAGTDIVLGSPIAGRVDDALEDLVGFFVNTLVLRTDLSGDPSAKALIGAGARVDLGGLCPSGPAVRASGRDPEPAALARPPSAVPGHAGAAEQCRRALRAARAECRGRAGRHGHHQVRPDLRLRRAAAGRRHGAGARGIDRIRHRSVRPDRRSRRWPSG